MEKNSKITTETTFGDLIAAAGEVAFEYSDNDKEGYELVRYTLVELLKKTAQHGDFNRELEALESPSSLIH